MWISPWLGTGRAMASRNLLARLAALFVVLLLVSCCRPVATSPISRVPRSSHKRSRLCHSELPESSLSRLRRSETTVEKHGRTLDPAARRAAMIGSCPPGSLSTRVRIVEWSCRPTYLQAYLTDDSCSSLAPPSV